MTFKIGDIYSVPESLGLIERIIIITEVLDSSCNYDIIEPEGLKNAVAVFHKKSIFAKTIVLKDQTLSGIIYDI